LAKQEIEGWVTKITDQLSNDLKQEFPDNTRFSIQNLKYIRALAEAWPDEQIVQ
jgi:hypothetical protein